MTFVAFLLRPKVITTYVSLNRKEVSCNGQRSSQMV